MAETESAPPTPTYHVDIWAMPEPQYVCMRCVGATAFRGDIPAVTQHLREAHDADAVPTPTINSLLGLRRESDERSAARAATEAAAAPAPAPTTAPPEETPHG